MCASYERRREHQPHGNGDPERGVEVLVSKRLPLNDRIPEADVNDGLDDGCETDGHCDEPEVLRREEPSEDEENHKTGELGSPVLDCGPPDSGQGLISQRRSHDGVSGHVTPSLMPRTVPGIG